jgi:hypothetical protein
VCVCVCVFVCVCVCVCVCVLATALQTHVICPSSGDSSFACWSTDATRVGCIRLYMLHLLLLHTGTTVWARLGSFMCVKGMPAVVTKQTSICELSYPACLTVHAGKQLIKHLYWAVS